MAKKKTPPKKSSTTTFEESLAELEKIVSELEDGKIGLNDALQRYEQGVKLLTNCYQLLDKAERRIELLSGVDADGNPIVRQFDDEAAENESADSRRRSRTKAKRRRGPASTVDDGSGLF